MVLSENVFVMQISDNYGNWVINIVTNMLGFIFIRSSYAKSNYYIYVNKSDYGCACLFICVFTKHFDRGGLNGGREGGD